MFNNEITFREICHWWGGIYPGVELYKVWPPLQCANNVIVACCARLCKPLPRVTFQSLIHNKSMVTTLSKLGNKCLVFLLQLNVLLNMSQSLEAIMVCLMRVNKFVQWLRLQRHREISLQSYVSRWHLCFACQSDQTLNGQLFVIDVLNKTVKTKVLDGAQQPQGLRTHPGRACFTQQKYCLYKDYKPETEKLASNIFSVLYSLSYSKCVWTNW